MWRGEQPRYGWGELGQLCPSTLHPGPLISAPPPPVATPELLFRRRIPLCLQIKATCPCQCVMGGNQSYFYAGPCVTFPLCRYVVAWGRERKVEWQLDGSHNKTVIERYVIVAISGWSKQYQRDISVLKKKKRRKEMEPRKGTSFN